VKKRIIYKHPMTAYAVPKGSNISWKELYRYWLSVVGVVVGNGLRPLITLGLIVISAIGLSAAGIDSNPLRSASVDVSFPVMDTVPAPARTTSRKAPFQSASQTERARAAIILKHTILGTPPPPPEELERQRRERGQKVEQRKAERQAMLDNRLERRSQRIAVLRNEEGNDSKANNQGLDKQSRGERRRETDRRKAARKREEALAKREAERQQREAQRTKLMAKRKAERQVREVDKAQLIAKRVAERQQQEEEAEQANELLAKQAVKRQEQARLTAKITARREAERKEQEVQKARLVAKQEAKRKEREAAKAVGLAKQAARKAARDLRKAEKLAAREARRNERLASKKLRRAERLARRAARRAARLARREARRLRRKQNPPYWTVEPAIALGLPARSGGASEETSLEAITVQALAGYHRANGLSLRGGIAASVINSKVSSKETTTETVSQTAVVRIILNPDGSRTEELGAVQVPQTTTRETRYYNSLNSIDFPLLLGYRIKGNRYGLMVEAGPSLNLSGGGNAHIRHGEGFQAVSSGHFMGRRPGIGFLLMLTGEYKLKGNNALIGGVRIQSFGRAFENPEVTGNATRVTTLSLQVGYRVRF
jgi:hypothetical protein